MSSGAGAGVTFLGTRAGVKKVTLITSARRGTSGHNQQIQTTPFQHTCFPTEKYKSKCNPSNKNV